MTAKKISATTVAKHEFANYRDKGLQFFCAMQLCFQDQWWDSVFLNGVHAAISLADAVAVFRLGKRSTAQSHRDAMELFAQAVGDNPEGERHAKRLGEILNWKHEVEYEPRRLTAAEAQRFVQSVQRFVEWVKQQLP
ncbi:MAG: hypothetical protein HYV03_06175 [Deltaproteobacteria bacterium]|nr:hypothetical protein [Deltaproteobacteria bacterium]